MVLLPLIQSAEAAARASSIPNPMPSMKPRSMQGKRRLVPRITLPLVILAIAATFSSHVTATGTNVPAPKVTTPASLDNVPFSSVFDDQETVVATAVSIPATDEVKELRVRRESRDLQSDKQDSGDTEEDNSLPTSKVLDGRSTSTNGRSSSPLPSPFDNPVPSSFQIPGGSKSCPNFMASLLSDPTFKSCYPISMLIQTSMGFFNAKKSLVNIVKVLDATCAADVNKCSDFLNKAAQNLTTEANCKSEFEQNQTQVLLAYRGLRAYKVLYLAACLQDPTTSSYCFANAVTDLSTPSDSYLYFMPYGNALPGGSKLTCNWCTQNTMSVYHTAAADRSQPVASRYEDAARQVNTLCGPTFVNTSLPAAVNGAFPMAAPSSLMLVTNTFFVLLLFTFFS